jgi:predicted CXXCH cytochrome family protein
VESPGPKFELPVTKIAQGKFKELEMFRKLAGLTAIAGLFIASSASADISGSVHDFSVWSANGELCVVCHTPHSATEPSADAPLWDHVQAAPGDFTPYIGYDLESTAGVSAGSLSLLCLSCHDGVTAIDNYGGNGGTTTLATQYPGTTAVVGQSLLDDHPIGVSYTATEITADGGLQLLTNPVGGGDVQSFLLGAANTTVECASCHDVHNEGTGGNLLKIPNTNSDLCVACHTK